MTGFDAALRGTVRTSVARGSGGITRADLDPDEWERAIGETLVDLELRASGPSRFLGTLRTRGAVDVLVTDISASPCRGTTGGRAAGAAPEYIFCHQVSGHGVIDQDGRTAALSPGGFAVYAAHRPADTVFRDGFQAVSLHVPGHVLDVPATTLDDMTARDLTAPACGPVAAVGEYLRWVNDTIDGARGDARGRMIRTALDLLGSVAREWSGSRADAATDAPGRSLHAEMLGFIERNLAVPALGPATVAQAHFVSVRSVHAVFHDHGESVATYIRRRRLARCAAELVDPASADVPVAVIGRRWGFESAPHFGELFRKTYDETPSGYRRRHLGSGG